MHIKELYDLFGFKDFNEEAITNYYRKWITTLDELSKKDLPKNIFELLCDKNNFDVPISNFDDLK